MDPFLILAAIVALILLVVIARNLWRMDAADRRKADAQPPASGESDKA